MRAGNVLTTCSRIVRGRWRSAHRPARPPDGVFAAPRAGFTPDREGLKVGGDSVRYLGCVGEAYPHLM